MGILSNFPWLRGAPEREVDEGAPVDLRPVRAGELEPAIRLMMVRGDGRIDETQTQGIIQLAQSQRAGGGPWVAAQGNRLVTAALPILGVGRTMLLFPPLGAPSGFHEAVARRLIDTICHWAAAQGTELGQGLVDLAEGNAIRLLEGAGFSRLAELIYLQGNPSKGLKVGPLPSNFHWHTYSAQTHHFFGRAILESYQQSLDCPTLNGMRDIEDIIAGHRATGEFDPAIWFVLTDGPNVDAPPAGVLLLNRVPRAGVTELVYLGVSPAYRGKGLGDVLLRRALMVVAGLDCNRISLAVDSLNEPALKLYWRHGLQSVGKRVAMMRDLRAR